MQNSTVAPSRSAIWQIDIVVSIELIMPLLVMENYSKLSKKAKPQIATIVKTRDT